MTKRSLEVLAIAGVGAAAAAHSLGLVFHRLESETWIDRDVIFHGFCIIFLGAAINKHIKKAGEAKR